MRHNVELNRNVLKLRAVQKKLELLQRLNVLKKRVEPKKLAAGASFLPNGTEAAGTMLLDYGEQQTTISYSKVTSSVHPSIVQGELGTLVFDTLNQPSYLRLLYRDGRTEELFTPVKNNMVHELNAFARMIANGESAAEYDEQSLRVMRLLDEARRQIGIDFGAGEAL